jgi:GT2 family glycosyltransferase
MTKRIGLILLHYSNVDDTLACLESLWHVKTTHHLKIYLVVVGKETGWLKTHQGRQGLTVIAGVTNLGYSGGNNIGIRQALDEGCEQVVILNPDTVVAKDFLDPLVETLDDPKVGLVSPLIYFYPGSEYHHDEYQEKERGQVIWYAGGLIDWNNVYTSHLGVDEVDHGLYKETSTTDYATGCCMAFTPKLIEEIGLLDEDYFLYYEDAAFSVMARRRGYEVRVAPQSKIWHKNAGSTQGAGSSIHRYYQTRNRVLFAGRFAPLRSRLAVWREALTHLFHPDETIRKAIKDAIMGKRGERKDL